MRIIMRYSWSSKENSKIKEMRRKGKFYVI